MQPNEKEEYSQPLLLENEERAQPRQVDTRLPMPVIVLLALATVFGVFQGLSVLMMMPMSYGTPAIATVPQEFIYGSSKVPLEVHIM